MVKPLEPVRRTNSRKMPKQVVGRELVRMAQTVEAHDRPGGMRWIGSRRFGGSFSLTDLRPWSGWIKITGAPTGAAYPWYELYDDGAGVSAQQTEGRSGTAAVNPAYEINGGITVPVGAIVYAWISYDHESYLFSYPQTTLAGSLSFTGDDFFIGPTVQFGDATHATVVTVVKGGVSFPVSVSAGTAPAAYLVIPYLDVSGPPTYTPTDDGELICSKDGSLYQGNPSNPSGPWMRYLPTLDPLPAPGSDPQFPYYDPTDKAYELLPLPNVHAPVRAATTANGTLATAFENGDTVDGITLVTGDRILLKNQATASDNGIYTVNASGAPTRAADADAGKLKAGAWVIVTEGTANADTGWLLTTNDPISVGSTGQTWAQFPAPADALPTTPGGGSTTLSSVPQWVKVTKSYTDFSTAGTTNDIEIFSLPAAGVVHAVILKQSTQFAAPGLGSYTVSVGVTGNLTKYSTAYNVNTPVSDSNQLVSTTAQPDRPAFSATTSIRAKATSAGANLNAATAGVVDIWLLLSQS